MTRRKTADQRIGGFAGSERADAKYLLLAFAGMLPVIVSDGLGWSRGPLWHVMLWLGVVWAVLVAGYGFVGYFRAIRQFMRRKR